jgi:ankyrin repeat protein
MYNNEIFPTYNQADKDRVMNKYKTRIEEGKCVDSLDNYRKTPLTNACRLGHTECVRMLLEHGVDPNKTDKDGHSPLIWACHYYHIKIIKSVLDKKEIDADKELYTIYSNILKNNNNSRDNIKGKLLQSPQDISEDDIDIGFQIIAATASFGRSGAVYSIYNDIFIDMLVHRRKTNADLIQRLLKNALMYRFDEIKDEVIDMLLDAGAKRFI